MLEHNPADQDCLSKFMTATIQAALASRRPAYPAVTNPLQAQNAREIKAASGPSKQESMASEAKVRRRLQLSVFDSLFCYLFFMQAAAKARVVAEQQPSQTHTAKEQ